MSFRPLFIAVLVAFLVGIVGFFVLFLTSSRPVTESGRPLPVIGSRFSPPPASSRASPPPAPGPVIRANPISPAFGSPLARPLAVQEFVEPILDAVGDAAREGRLPSLPNAFQVPPAAGGAYSPTTALPRYEDLVKAGAPFLFPPRYVHYIRVIRRIMVLNGVVTDDFYPEVRENRDMVAVMEQFANYVISLQPVDVLTQERQKRQLLDGIHLDLQLLANEYPKGFPRPEPGNKVTKSAEGKTDSAVRVTPKREKFFSFIFDFLPIALAQEGGGSPAIDADLAAGIDIVGGEGTFGDYFDADIVDADIADAEGIGGAIGAAACIIGSGTIKDCYKEKGANPSPGVNLWAPCCDCGIPVKGYCIPIGCVNLVCRFGNAIWDPATGICGCDQF